jgi:hypothetical protein
MKIGFLYSTLLLDNTPPDETPQFSTIPPLLLFELSLPLKLRTFKTTNFTLYSPPFSFSTFPLSLTSPNSSKSPINRCKTTSSFLPSPHSTQPSTSSFTISFKIAPTILSRYPPSSHFYSTAPRYHQGHKSHMDAPSEDIIAEDCADLKTIWPDVVSEDEGFQPELFWSDFWRKS